MEIDFTKSVEAYHEDGRTMPVSSIHPWGNDQWPWCGVADTEHIYMGKHGCSRSVHGDMPGWRIRNRRDQVREDIERLTNTTPINRELWERCVGLVRELEAQWKEANKSPFDIHGDDVCAYTTVGTFREAREIAKLLPVVGDADLIEARKIGAEIGRNNGNNIQQIMRPDCWSDGTNDDTHKMQLILAALKRGRELERSK